MNTKEILANMTLQEKASFVSGSDFWHTDAVERLGIDKIMMTDGPHGVRKVEYGPGDSNGTTVEAVCFPSGSTLACSFDRELMADVGRTLGRECIAEDVDMLLGPAVNIKRSPLCGRNFEYFSEDPYLAGELGAAYVNGLQSTGTAASVKHFAVNNQETRRCT
ncbi:MAG: glycoside hydrolase family 3 protein, partial [Lachnospiraceae bacterium]|nr:glycoside hydrolase family 3 protein [Lachnospiraceae bacterium]